MGSSHTPMVVYSIARWPVSAPSLETLRLAWWLLGWQGRAQWPREQPRVGKEKVVQGFPWNILEPLHGWSSPLASGALLRPDTHFHLQSLGPRSQCGADFEGAGVIPSQEPLALWPRVLFQPQSPWQVAEG